MLEGSWKDCSWGENPVAWLYRPVFHLFEEPVEFIPEVWAAHRQPTAVQQAWFQGRFQASVHPKGPPAVLTCPITTPDQPLQRRVEDLAL